ncbi:MAG TPA: hypothetical protein VFK84_08815 [Burkholderiales bacterium]|nr:hypothetical protein [Burkholderiales bacterium]
MKTLIAMLCAAVMVAACGQDPNSGKAAAGAAKGSMETPKGAATGQASEGSTDARKAPQRPDSK